MKKEEKIEVREVESRERGGSKRMPLEVVRQREEGTGEEGKR